MASRIIHLATCEEIRKRTVLKDNDKFIIGQLLPDATAKDTNIHHKTHLVKVYKDKNCKTYDFTSFFNFYKEEIYNDEIYLGYYIHLVEDAIFRKYAYEKWGLLDKKKT